MEVFINSLDSKTTKSQLSELLQPVLQRLDITFFDVFKQVGNTFGNLTVTDPSKGLKLINLAQTSLTPLFTTPLGRKPRFHVSKRPPNVQLLRVLQKEEKDASARNVSKRVRKQATTQDQTDKQAANLEFIWLEYGSWSNAGTTGRCFVPYHRETSNTSPGKIARRGRDIIITLNIDDKVYELVVDVAIIASMAVTHVHAGHAVTMTLSLAPKIYHKISGEIRDTRNRLCKLPGATQHAAGSCAAYRFTLTPTTRTTNSITRILHNLTSSLTLVHRQPPDTPSVAQADFNKQILDLTLWLLQAQWSFPCKFQISALWTNSLLTPYEVRLLLPTMESVKSQSGDDVLIKVLQNLRTQLQIADSVQGGWQQARNIISTQHRFWTTDSEQHLSSSSSSSSRDEVYIHKITITPTGMYLEGPEEIAANRVLRKYRDKRDCFIRVTFTEEDWGKVQFDRDTSNKEIFEGRFLQILRTGLGIAGEHFDFLGFSHSSLRTQTCWFMRSFVENGSLLFAKNLIQSLGDFSSIRCPAKCAARIGQAFSETSHAFYINPKTVRKVPDIQRNGYTFTDGCGTVSTATWKLLKKASASKKQPTCYQIRYKGAKGMLSLDIRLQGQQMLLRDSMIKFTGSSSDEIEICGTNGRSLPFKLNRQLIKILEDLKIPASVFEKLQQDAVNVLRANAKSKANAIDFVKSSLSDSATGLPLLLKTLTSIEIDVTEDSFLRDIMGALLQLQLREIKYRSRILVPHGVTLYGICDETNFLREGQVYVNYTSTKSDDNYILTGRIAVTRSPALHPGDVQLVQAVDPPSDSPLKSLHNCIVFSSQGQRDLPSMLSGGDLDGDLFNVIYDPALTPSQTYTPAAYAPAKPIDIGRTVNSDDMKEFFVDFMQNDQLGRIATLHQVFADTNPEGTLSAECMLLAELHSTAVDFSKTGVKVDVARIPRALPYRPDFMAPSASTMVETGVVRPLESVLEQQKEPGHYRYYESKKVLGELYRVIDEDLFFEELEDDTSSLFSSEATDNVLPEILQFVKGMMEDYSWQEYISKAEEVRDYYEANIMLSIMSSYGSIRGESLTEKEVFIGSIVGRSGAGSKWQRERSDFMKSQFNAEIRDLKAWMEKETADDDDGYLCLAAACVYVAVKKPSNITHSNTKPSTPLRSFGWFAAALCVPQLVGETYDVGFRHAAEGTIPY